MDKDVLLQMLRVATPPTTPTSTPASTLASTPARGRTTSRPRSGDDASSGGSRIRPRPRSRSHQRSRSRSRPRAVAQSHSDGEPHLIDKNRLLTLLAKADEIVALDELEDEIHAELMQWATAVPQHGFRRRSLAAEDAGALNAEAVSPDLHARLRASIVDCVGDHPRAEPLVAGGSVSVLLEICRLIEQELGEDEE